ncbi:MAG: glycosyltransferase family 2 protein [candidate division Zixibacteria bacterium]|nr:glycosyltransferase family 2 protein [candidate division Zixibacteria bacterium]
MSDVAPTLAAIVVNYNTPALVQRLIDSIKQHSRQIDYEVVVVNNGCRPDGRYLASAGSTFIRLIESPVNVGFGAAVNLAARTCNQELLLFANSDCRLDSNVIPKLAAFMSAHSGCAACSPRLIDERGAVHSSLRRFPTHDNIRNSRGAFFRSGGEYTIEADQSRKPVEAMAATFMLVRRADFEQIGGFDERFFMYVEDTDLCRRFHDGGRECWYLGDLDVTHTWGASTRQHRFLMKYHHHCSVYRYFTKHYPDQKWRNRWLALQLGVNLLLVWLRQLLPGARP